MTATETGSSGDDAAPSFDGTDRLLFECLQIDGRMSIAEIARRTNLVEATVRRRLHRLQEHGVLRVVPVVDPDTIGLHAALFVGVKVAAGRLTEVIDHIAQLREVRYVAAIAGPWDLIVEAFTAHRDHMANLVIDDIGRIDGVSETVPMPVLRVAKFAYEWEVPDAPSRR